MSSIASMTDGARSLVVLESAAAARRWAVQDLVTAVNDEHQAVWDAREAGASWRDLAWLVGEPLGTFYHRHRERGNPRIGRVS